MEVAAPAMQRTNRTITEACRTWRHKFAGGKKRPRVLSTDGMPPSRSEDFGTICGEAVELVDVVKVLGVLIDRNLSAHAQLEKTISLMLSEGLKLTTGMAAAGFGVPAVASQFTIRTVPKAFNGSVILASLPEGFSKVASQLNMAQYTVAKAVLGIPTKVPDRKQRCWLKVVL